MEKASQPPSPSHVEIDEAMSRLLESEGLANSERLQDFLRYVVVRAIDAPGEKIPAKVIAHDVYGRQSEAGVDNENVVRVDAGRLRRRLAEYYSGPGMKDPIAIHIDAGGYAPRFERRLLTTEVPLSSPSETPARSFSRNRLWQPFSVAILAASAGFGAAVFLLEGNHEAAQNSTATLSPNDRSSERMALMDKSPASLQAVNLSEQARDLIFPLFEREQVALTLGMFRHAIRKDKSYFGGYAGAAQALAALAVFEPDEVTRNQYLEEATEMAHLAESRGATEAWTQSAIAWVDLVSGRYDEAYRRALQAVDLAQDDGNVLDFHAIIMLCLGKFEEARSAGEAVRLTATDRVATRGFLGAANFHLGRYRESIKALESSAAGGGPISAPTLAYLSASHQALGQTSEAQRYAGDLNESWPQFRADIVLGRLYRDQTQADAVHSFLLLSGWQEPASAKRPSDK